jgi:hypothetical protein
VKDRVFSVGDYFRIGLTPISKALPNNPDVSKDHLSLFLNINKHAKL